MEDGTAFSPGSAAAAGAFPADRSHANGERVADRPDADLVAQFLDGNSAAFDALVRRYEEPLFGFLRRMLRDEELAEDVFQEAFLKVMNALPEYAERGRFRSWLFGLARNLALDVLRRRQREAGVFAKPRPDDEEQANPQELGIEDAAFRPDRIAERREFVEQFERALAELPEAQREVVTLRYQSGLTFREIAEITDCSINTALGRMRYATTALKKKLGAFIDEQEGP